MEQADDTNILFRVVKRVFLEFERDGRSYHYKVEPKPIFQNFQELAVTYLFNLDQIRVILLNVLNCYKTYGDVEEYDKLSKLYSSFIKTQQTIEKCHGFSDVPKLQRQYFENLYSDIPKKLQNWNAFKRSIQTQKNIVLALLEKRNPYYEYKPVYTQKIEKNVLEQLEIFSTVYRPVQIPKKLRDIESSSQTQALPSGYVFDNVKPYIFHCPNGHDIAFKGKKFHSYKVFHRLVVSFGQPISVPVLLNLTKPTSVRRVISDIKPKLVNSGLKIINDRDSSYSLTVT